MHFTVFPLSDIKRIVLFCGLERAPTFLVPIINPPFADNSPRLQKKGRNHEDFALFPTSLD